MQYIIFDLEWNSCKDIKTDKYVNEIIEIGAVKLDENLTEIDSFNQFIKPTLSDRLNKYVKNLTNINENDLRNANGFKQIIDQFKKWCNTAVQDCVFLTWSNTDLYVITQNINIFLKKKNVSFINKYVDLQKYVARFINFDNGNNNQISLATAADCFSIDTSQFELHRALSDSRICAAILKETMDNKIFSLYVNNIAKGNFYKRLMYKPFYISNINNPLVDKTELVLKCPNCREKTNQTSSFIYKHKAFNAKFRCNDCKKNYYLSVRFKKTFDSVIVSRTIKPKV